MNLHMDGFGPVVSDTLKQAMWHLLGIVAVVTAGIGHRMDFTAPMARRRGS